MQDRQHFIEAHETIIPVIYMGSIQRAFAQESPFFGKAMNAAEVLTKLAEDEVIAVLRLDTRTWKTELVTEECAKFYIEDHENRFGELDLSDESTLPEYVKTSTAWAVKKDDIEAMQPVRRDDVDRMPVIGSRVYSALEVAQ